MEQLISQIAGFVTTENNSVAIAQKDITLDSTQKIVACIDGGSGLQKQDESLEQSAYKINVFGGFAGIVLNLYKACCDVYGKEMGRTMFEAFHKEKLTSSYLHSCNHYHDDNYKAVHFQEKKSQGEVCHIGCGHLNKNLSQREKEDRERYTTHILGQNSTNGDFTDMHGISSNERNIDILHRDHKEMAIVINMTPFDQGKTTYTIKTNRLFDDAKEIQLFFYDKTLDDELLKVTTQTFNERKKQYFPTQQDILLETLNKYNALHQSVTLNKLGGATQLIKDGKVYTVILSPERSPIVEQYDGLKKLLREK